jgi:hypothetical protein
MISVGFDLPAFKLECTAYFPLSASRCSTHERDRMRATLTLTLWIMSL